MKKLLNHGFTSLEILIAVMVLIAVGAAGYYVWQTKKISTDQTTHKTSQMTSKKSFADSGVSFVYPSNWKISSDTDNQITFVSPDFKEKNVSTEAPDIESGSSIKVRLVTNDIDQNGKVKHLTVDNYSVAAFPDDKNFIQNPTVTIINGYKTFQYSHASDYLYTVFFLTETTRVEIELWHADKIPTAEQSSTYKQLLQSIKLTQSL